MCRLAIVGAMSGNPPTAKATFVDPAPPGAVQNGSSWTDANTSASKAGGFGRRIARNITIGRQGNLFSDHRL